MILSPHKESPIKRILRVTRRPWFTAIFTIISVLFWILIWQLLAKRINKPLLLPYPSDVLQRLFTLSGSALFWKCTALSLFRVMLGILYAILLGILFAILTAKLSLFRILLRPLLSVIRSTPVAAFIVLILLWLGRDEVPIVITMLIALPPVWKNLETGILSADPSLLQMGKALGLPLWKRVLYIWIPSVLPHFRSSVQTAIGLGWKAGIAAEILALPTTSVGREIYNANLLLETTDLFAWTLSVVLLSLLIELAFSGLLGRLTRFGESSAQRRREAQ